MHEPQMVVTFAGPPEPQAARRAGDARLTVVIERNRDQVHRVVRVAVDEGFTDADETFAKAPLDGHGCVPSDLLRSGGFSSRCLAEPVVCRLCAFMRLDRRHPSGVEVLVDVLLPVPAVTADAGVRNREPVDRLPFDVEELGEASNGE
jgi:hypothetical protein